MQLKFSHLTMFIQRIRTTKGVRFKISYLKFAYKRFLELATTPSVIAAETLIHAAVRRADTIGYIWSMRLEASISSASPVRMNLLIPAFDPNIIFGGYISYFQFARYCLDRGAKLRFIVTEQFGGSLQEIIAHCKTWFPEVTSLLETAEVVDYTGAAKPHLMFSADDIVVAYSCTTAIMAHNTVRALGLPPFIFYIQEEEGHFHAHNSMRALMESVYTLPHTAIFNSPMLENYYRQNRLGVFAGGDGDRRSVSFRHALSVHRVPTASELIRRRPRKLLFFARPEPHAERNLFELGLVALRYATYLNLFPREDWALHAIGTQCFAPEHLYNGQRLEFIGRFPLSEYSRRLADYDVGLSLMYAPHPSVPNFEMAASGLVTVTTEFSNRRKAEMERLCPNFVVSKPDVASLVDALGRAAARSGEWETRRRNAHFDWPRSWAESFGAEFSNAFAAMAGLNYPSIDKVLPGLGRRCGELGSGGARAA